ncbi:fumarylacetoacetate hydrolase family protein [Sphaerisporangium aureirubrum]|uniref:Fumarylacetoacetate hydrolase family protein n=1 Tax=Sphaerisporangium aureirubrum TaxID=1544736 RepID=A0ABW1NJQ0_9ACTN
MKLVSFRTEQGDRYGVVAQDGTVADPRHADPSLPAALNDLLADRDALRRAAGAADAGARVGKLADLELLPAVPHPSKIICIGVNYADHAAETNSDLPPYPTVFGKFTNALSAHGRPIVLPAESAEIDYEAELAVVIGATARHVSEADALTHVAGYAPFNDVSARDWQSRTSQWDLGKSFDGFGPVGPYITTADEIDDPQDLTVRLTIDGEVLQEASTGDMVFPVRRLVSYLSSVITLYPGDIIATGTPSGVGMARDPRRWLRPGDLVRVEISGLGALENPVVDGGTA